ncbi:TPA: EAL domain-containing protein [Legionella pneumophila]|nr:EAL domain-containing protein [Legionella pneumophila]HAT8256426.1 EAL domain-containing protein [Legionella pneumophila]HAT8259853.1 EAL domain-containing protein [Legionella pneumophila]HAT8269121.1 EAL domain-containing protein [Legionella pneumophila]HAT8273907.1 EAL domain-containing protein [Legionella pneumophila]
MSPLKSKIKTKSFNKLTKTQDITNTIERLFANSQDSIIVFNQQGKIIAINEKAAALFKKSPDKLIDKPIWKLFKLNSFAIKRQFIQAKRCFLLANEGIAQQFTWLESKEQKPVLAYHILFNKTEIEDTSIIFTKLTDILKSKTIEWILWSLTKISNHQEINEIIDQILQLTSDVFAADYTSVSFVNNQQIARTISYYKFGKKEENISFSLINTPCAKVIQKKAICYFNDVQKQFPNDKLLKRMDINTYLAGPITNPQDEVIGIMTILCKRKVEFDTLNNTLFGLFLSRINSEIERLINLRKLEFLASIPQQNPNPIIRILLNGDVVFTNEEGKIILNYWIKLFKGLPVELLKEAQRIQKSNQSTRIEMEIEDKIYLFTLVWIDEFKQINIYGTDITQLKNTQNAMLNLTRRDTLTQIANRQYFEEKLIEKIYEHHLKEKSLALLLIDLDNFKSVNDTLGHPIGDKLLMAVTNRMTRCLRANDFIARLGGDEFIVLLDQCNTDTAVKVAEKIINVLDKPFQFDEYHMTITASIGIAIYPETSEIASDLLKYADIAMYQSKKTGKNKCTVFSKNLHYKENQRNEILKKDIELAALKRELYIDYQPQIDLSDNTIVGIEALLRWSHPTLGLILPTEFIPIAEQTGCIHTISQWFIEQTLLDYSQFQQLSSNIKLSINVSLSQLNDMRFTKILCDSLLQNNLSKSKIILDISERMIAPHFIQISKKLKQIHHIGINLSLDNFCCPQISLPELLSLPLDYLKVDQRLLIGIEGKIKLRKLLSGIINLTKDLNIKIIQKGIETAEQHEVIKSLGCQYAQGYFYCKPVALNDLLPLIKKNIH